MQEFFVGIGEKPFRATQVIQWIHQYGVDDFDAMTNLSKELRARLRETAEIRLPEVMLDQTAADGTRKWLLRLNDGNAIESVFIPEEDRGTLCVSSQVGCTLNCSFCSTGHQGFNRSLNVAEIISQLLVANRALGRDPKGDRIITNVVLMGMGEPLLNFRQCPSRHAPDAGRLRLRPIAPARDAVHGRCRPAAGAFARGVPGEPGGIAARAE